MIIKNYTQPRKGEDNLANNMLIGDFENGGLVYYAAVAQLGVG